MSQDPNNASAQSFYQTPNTANSYVAAQNNPEPVSIKDWIITMLLMIIPFVGIIMLIVWAASSSTNPSKKNFAIATLIFWGAFTLLYIIIVVIAFSNMGFR